LAKAGGFLKLHPNTNEILQNIQIILSYAEKEKSDDSQFSLFGDAEVKTRPTMKQVPKMTANEDLLAEFEAFGFYLSSHPLVNFSEKIERYEIKSFTQVNEMIPQDSTEITVKMAGVISILKQRSGNRGRFAFLHISDLTGVFEVAIFKDDIIEKNRDILEVGKVIIMNVSASKHESGNARLIVNDLTSIENDAKIQEFRGSSPRKFWQNKENKKDDKKDETPRVMSNAKFETSNNNQVSQTTAAVDYSFLHSKKVEIDAENVENISEVLSEIKNFKAGETEVLITTKGFKVAIGFYTIPMDFIRNMGQVVKI
jgi:DNA polymerase III alpha subunit